MALLIIAFGLWALSALARAGKEAAKQKELERQREEQARMRQEMRERMAEAKLETARLIALEREQMRMAKEQERQAAILEKQEKRIADLEYKVRKLDRDIEAQGELLADYYAQLDWLLLQQSGTVVGGSEFAKWQNKIVTKQNQIRKAENKLADMNDAKERAARELAA
jgi:hypothetical protein